MRHKHALIAGYPRAMFRHVFMALAAAATAAASPALAQPQTAPRGDDWYRQQLTDLAEVLGGSHYLRILCEGRGDQRWRTYMQGVIQREPQYSDDLTAAFNHGYRDQEARFPTCDETTRQMEAELRARGLRISQGLGAHHTER
ncbi:MAG: TIGR02301 family protein [Proteobacteria bacterium]|nr:TIGR02301 family protein [Pseudomonadota bacterium]